MASDSDEDRMLPFFEFDETPPQDIDALMAFDRRIFETHPGLKVFMRPLTAADFPEGKLTYKEKQMSAEEVQKFRDQFRKEAENYNYIRVTLLGPGARARHMINATVARFRVHRPEKR